MPATASWQGSATSTITPEYAPKREPAKSRTPRQRKAKAKRAGKTHGKSK